MEELLQLATDVLAYIEHSDLDKEHKELYNSASTLYEKIAQMVGDES